MTVNSDGQPEGVRSDAEEVRQLRAALRKTQQELAAVSLENERLTKELRRAQRRIDSAWEQIYVLRHSVSWQMTAPVRLAKSRLVQVLR